jgi:hypothetical protein
VACLKRGLFKWGLLPWVSTFPTRWQGSPIFKWVPTQINPTKI